MIFSTFPNNVLVLDVETTGTDPARHAIVEIGAVLLDAQTLQELTTWSSLIGPWDGAEIDPAAMAIHGHDLAELVSAPSPQAAAQSFCRDFAGTFTLAGWNVAFDAQFLRAFLHMAGFEVYLGAIDYHRLDIWSIAQYMAAIGWINAEVTSLSRLCTAFDLPRAEVHSGLEDAQLAAEILRRLVRIGREHVS